LESSPEFDEWALSQDEDAREAFTKNLIVLSEFGPTLGRPHVDTVDGSRHSNMKELRIQNKKRVFRIFFAFMPDRTGILLIGGDKRGKKKFYARMIAMADAIFDRYLR